MNGMKIRLRKKEDLSQIMKLGNDVFCGENWYGKGADAVVFDYDLK